MKSCSNTPRWQITLARVQVAWLVGATCCSDTSQRQITLCVQENFCKNLCLHNKLQKIIIRLNLCNFLRRQNSVAEKKIFIKIIQYAWRDLLLQFVVATCWYNVSPSVYWPLPVQIPVLCYMTLLWSHLPWVERERKFVLIFSRYCLCVQLSLAPSSPPPKKDRKTSLC